jgi:hypothetical protein
MKKRRDLLHDFTMVTFVAMMFSICAISMFDVDLGNWIDILAVFSFHELVFLFFYWAMEKS